MLDRPFVVKYRPVPVKKLLMKMKDEASLVLDMAFYSLVYEDKDVAQEVERIDADLDNDFNLLSIQLMVAARDVEDAEKLLPALRMGVAADWVSEAASDISAVVLKGYPVDNVVKAALEITEEVYLRIEVNETLSGMSIKELKERYGAVDVIALRRGGVLIPNPSDDVILERGDIIIVRGNRDDIMRMAKSLGLEFIIPDVNFTDEEREIATRLALLKNMAEVAFDLAVYSLLYQDNNAAEEVLEIERFMDEESAKLELEMLKLARDKFTTYTSTVLIRSLEKVTDAATAMAQLALSGIEVHPILKEVAEEGEEKVLVLYVTKDCEMSVSDVEEALDATVLAIYVEGVWIPMPNSSTKLKKGMKLLIKAYSEPDEIPECLSEP